MDTLPRNRDYPIIRFLIGSLYVMSFFLLIVGLGSSLYLWLQAEAMRDGFLARGPLADTISRFNASQLCLAAVFAAVGGLASFLLLGATGQILAMQRNRAIHAATQVQLLEDILELNEEVAASSASRQTRVDLCEGCGRLGSLQQIESGQWICRECRKQLRTA